MASETTICNLALAHLGEAPIASLNEDSLASRAANLHFRPTLEAMLRSHRWNFAEERAALQELNATPDFGWDHQFELPSDCLRVLELNDTEIGDVLTDTCKIEGTKLLTDADSANIVYTKNITDTSLFDPLFVKALAMQLAIDMSESIRGTTGKTAELQERLARLVGPLARRIDANEGNRRKGLLALNSQAIRARSCGV